PTDPAALLLALAGLATIGFIASYVPARRATRIEPIVALRVEEVANRRRELSTTPSTARPSAESCEGRLGVAQRHRKRRLGERFVRDFSGLGGGLPGRNRKGAANRDP